MKLVISILFIIVVVLISTGVIIIWSYGLYRDGHMDGYQAALQDVKEAEKSSPAEKEKPFMKDMEKEKPFKTNTYQNLLEYFDEKELVVIHNAALRNDCRGDNFVILLAIRMAEHGGEGMEFGVMHHRAWKTNLDTQAGWAAATVVKNRQRWIDADKPEPFIKFLGDRYCPPDDHPLNKNWVKNVTHWYKRFKPPEVIP